MTTIQLDVMAIMHQDVLRALAKTTDERRWSMVIDLQRCIGCHACTVACKSENKTPPGVMYNVVADTEVGTYPDVRREFLPRPCMHCAKPPCVEVCPVRPVKATYRRPDGVVEIDYERCIGCLKCLPACPYGARSVDNSLFYTNGTPAVQPYEEATTFDYGRQWSRHPGQTAPPMFKARKCHYCLHRLETAALPACVTTCLGRARYFGDLNDPESLVSRLLGDSRAGVLKPELGTEPTTHYLFLPAYEVPGDLFSDVPADHAYYREIGRLASAGLVDGYSDGTFRPDAPVSRRQMAKIVVLATGLHTAAIDNLQNPTFADVDPDMGVPYPFDYIEESANAGFFEGDEGRFRPDEHISRVQLALVLVRAGGQGLEDPPPGYDAGFADVPDYAVEAVAKAKSNSILDGKTPKAFDPYSSATRGQLCKMVSRLLDKIGWPTAAAV